MQNTNNKLIDNQKVTAPFNETGTGTISTDKLGLIGTGTIFKTELLKGAYILDLPNDEYKKVVEVISDTYAILESAFTTDLPALTAMDYIPAWKGNVREISVIIPALKQDMVTANPWGKIDGEDFPPGVGNSFSKANRDNSSVMDVLNPLILDASGTQMYVTQTF